MHSSILRAAAQFAVLFVCCQFLLSGASAQGTGSTIVSASTPGTVQESPKFALVPVGDHPNGYIQDLPVKPGSAFQLSVNAENFGEVPVTLRIYKVNAHNSVNGGFAAGEEEEPAIGATEWMDFAAQTFTLQSTEVREFTFTVQVPEDVTPGQHITGLMLETAEPMAISGTETLNQVMGYVMSVSFLSPGDLTYSINLGEPEVDDRTLRVPVSNTGNYLVRPKGELVLSNGQGEEVMTTPIQMGSVYAGNSTSVTFSLPEQLPPGTYTLSMSLADEESGASTLISAAEVEVPVPVNPTGVSVLEAVFEPNADEIVFANVDVTLDNGGQQIPATNVLLEVMRDGEQVDSFPLATNQVLLSGENQFTTRYIPAEMWESGTYTFRIVVSAVDPNGGQETVLLDEELDASIEVP